MAKYSWTIVATDRAAKTSYVVARFCIFDRITKSESENDGLRFKRIRKIQFLIAPFGWIYDYELYDYKRDFFFFVNDMFV